MIRWLQLSIKVLGIAIPLEISLQYMLFVGGRAVPASAVTVGNKLSLVIGGGVSEVQLEQRVVAVNSFAASVYVDLGDIGELSTSMVTKPRLVCSFWLMCF